MTQVGAGGASASCPRVMTGPDPTPVTVTAVTSASGLVSPTSPTAETVSTSPTSPARSAPEPAPPAVNPTRSPSTVFVLGVTIDRHDRASARRRIVDLATGADHHAIAFVNAHSLNLAARDRHYRQVLERSSLVLNDGLGLDIAARLDGTYFPANLNGTDLLPDVLADLARAGSRVFFYGGLPGVAAATAETWRTRISDLAVAGWLDGYTVSWAAAAEIIRGADADVVLVAMGNPRQELWADFYGARTGARLTIGVGAFFDFSTGMVRRAPAVVRQARLEWAFRLAQEPRRLGRRYLLGIPAFLLRVAAQQAVPWRRPGSRRYAR